MKLSVLLLVGVFVFGMAAPATAQQIIDDSTVARIRVNLNKALDGLNRQNLTKAWNNIIRSLNLLPDAPQVTVNYFNVSTPFSWNQSNGPMPIQIGAMADHATPQPRYAGTVRVSMMAYGQVLALYDSSMRLLNFETTQFINGGWQGYVVLATTTGRTEMLGLAAFDPAINVGGNSLPIQWIVP